MSLRFRICLIMWLAVVLLTAATGTVQAQDVVTAATSATLSAAQPDEQPWTIQIIPAAKVSQRGQVQPEPLPANEEESAPVADAREYARVYASIPFNRAEYNVNPSYRHDATMEILTGNARHKTLVVHQNGQQQQAATTAVPAIGGIRTVPWIRPGLRLNYYRHFPSLNPYWNMFWNVGY
jgi:hypothetical protein